MVRKPGKNEGKRNFLFHFSIKNNFLLRVFQRNIGDKYKKSTYEYLWYSFKVLFKNIRFTSDRYTSNKMRISFLIQKQVEKVFVGYVIFHLLKISNLFHTPHKLFTMINKINNLLRGVKKAKKEET